MEYNPSDTLVIGASLREKGQAPSAQGPDPCGSRWLIPPGVRWGVRGEASVAGGSPRSYTARMRLWGKAPSRGLVPHEVGGPLCGAIQLNVGNPIRE